MDNQDFSAMVGKHFAFYGVDNNVFCLGDKDGKRRAYEAVEDESDGYRSMLKELVRVPLKGHIFFRTPIATVRVEGVEDYKRTKWDNGDFEGYRLVDVKTGHVWLVFGTDYRNDYYPMFTFDYEPQQ